jgi:hypothetical protein
VNDHLRSGKGISSTDNVDVDVSGGGKKNSNEKDVKQVSSGCCVVFFLLSMLTAFNSRDYCCFIYIA